MGVFFAGTISLSAFAPLEMIAGRHLYRGLRPLYTSLRDQPKISQEEPISYNATRL